MFRTLVTPRTARATPLTRSSRHFSRHFSTSRIAPSGLRIGFVPEHFSTPLHFAKKHYSLSAALLPFPSGTGHMVTALQSGEIDMAIGLTEGWVAGIGKAQVARKEAGFRIVGTYVESSLRWAVSTGAKRDDINSVEDLRGKKVGVSRIGSGSYVMSIVMANEKGWIENESTHPPFPVEVLQTFKNLRDAVNNATADFFMWEYYTSKRYFDNSEIKHIGDQYSPWSSWMIVASDKLLWPDGRHLDAQVLSEPLEDALLKINVGIQHFKNNKEEAVEYISSKLDYYEEDARHWVGSDVRFPDDVRGADGESVKAAAWRLSKAGVLEAKPKAGSWQDMVALERQVDLSVDSDVAKNFVREQHRQQ